MPPKGLFCILHGKVQKSLQALRANVETALERLAGTVGSVDNAALIESGDLAKVSFPLSRSDQELLAGVLVAHAEGLRPLQSGLSSSIGIRMLHDQMVPLSALKMGTVDPDGLAGELAQGALQVGDTYLRRVLLQRTQVVGNVPLGILPLIPFEDYLVVELGMLHLPDLLQAHLGTYKSRWEMFETLGEDWTGTLGELLQTIRSLHDEVSPGSTPPWTTSLPDLRYKANRDVSTLRAVYLHALRAWHQERSEAALPVAFQCALYTHGVTHGQEMLLLELLQGRAPLDISVQECYHNASSAKIRIGYIWSPQAHREDVAGLYPNESRVQVLRARTLRAGSATVPRPGTLPV